MRPELQILEQYVAENGLKRTRQRTLIAAQFLESGGHLSAEDLYAALNAAGHRVGLATVYRTLKMLVDAGLAQVRHFPDGATRYECVYGEPAHDHLICVECHCIIEIENPFLDQLYQHAFAAHGFVASGHRLVITGICSNCQAGAASN
ncbi:MAG: transcriptional repressor [Fimbriimonadaceae bacterium]|nr:transcriptional repressor [Fimbriimonadaceae bacterium]